jgi:stage II sporulation protein R
MKKMNLFKRVLIATCGILALSLFAAVISSSGIVGSPKQNFQASENVTSEELSTKLIRLHVIANSDSPEDQELKLKIRDDIINALDEQLGNMDDINESRKYIKNHLKDIEQIAKRQINESGKDYSVNAVFGKFPFPIKSYGYITLPAGEYEALRVIIGNGKGANWWCVLFPPLCFVDITHGLTNEQAKIQMSRVLTNEELKAIETAASPDEVPVEVRFKVAELWQTAVGKINRTIKLAFR